MRIDKFLKVSRLIKRRTVAKEACEQGRITINGRPAKAGGDVKEGDVIEIQFGGNVLTAKVLMVSETCKKEDSPSMYEIIQKNPL